MQTIYDENHTVMQKDGSLWLKVFYHNTTFGDYFTKYEDVLDSHTPQKFSILGLINEAFKIRGKYEFLLDVPGSKGFNRWRQKLHPNETTTTTNSTMNEYEPIKISWTESFIGGIAKSNSTTRTFFDCSTDYGQWWFPIGAKRHHTIENTIPVHRNPDYEGPEIRLWIRIPSGRIQTACKYNNRHHNIAIVIIVLVP